MRIKTKYLAVTTTKNRVTYRIGSYEYGIDGSFEKDWESYVRFNWGIASWTKTFYIYR